MKIKNMIMLTIAVLLSFIVLGTLIHRDFTKTPTNKIAGISESRACAPAAISPVLYKDIRILTENSTPINMGIVQAFDANTNKLIWSKKVYEVNIDPNIEEDTQWAFIKEMKIENDKLVVINEKSKCYTLDPNTGEVLNSD